MASGDPKDKAPLENRLADFNLWIDSVGATAKPGASLDSRFRDRQDDLRLVKSILIMLGDFLCEYRNIASRGASVAEALRNVDSSIKNLAMIGVAIRRTGKASRNRRADRTFDPAEYQELKRHLECIVLLRPGEETPQQGTSGVSAINELIAAKKGEFSELQLNETVASELNKLVQSKMNRLDESNLNEIQRRLIEANLRRRHRFLLAQKRHREARGSSTQQPSPKAPATQSLPSGSRPQAQERQQAKSTLPVSPSAPQSGERAPPTVTGQSIASTAEGSLQYARGNRRQAAVARTQITSIAANIEFPKPPSPSPDRLTCKCPCCCQPLPSEEFANPKIWR